MISHLSKKGQLKNNQSKEALQHLKWLMLSLSLPNKEGSVHLRWLMHSLSLLNKEVLEHLKWQRLLSLQREEHLELLR